MAYLGTQDQAATFARSALQRMSRDGITPCPEHFAVWYNYYSGSHPDLIRTIDSLPGSVSDETCVELFDRFFGWDHESRALRETGEALQRALDEVLGALRQAGTDADQFTASLDTFGRALDPAAGLDQMRRAVASIAAETRAVLEQNKAMGGRLADAARDLAKMRQDVEELQRESMTDGLTGIANRRYFDLELRSQVGEATENGQPLSLLLVDIDHFKRFNDTYGHPVGDEVLRLVARMLRDLVKGRDTTARFGGEEFAVILPATPVAGAGVVAEQIRKAVASKRLVRRASGEALAAVTLSVGVAQYRPDEALAALIERADQALYAAKRGGRNRVELEAAALVPA